ncbi:4-amino-4-deoxy-L-arabinose transferase-like glycosyltransferase [Nocardia transvalensis]|uniref:4-amino-4-deoxy-L-arabinose transferase-like glycosyltransferase n=1 Tax=Nocardia transvalensis TaxID=37333 RepID=A0A7W9PLA7_9NOCA|nr:glycosyltransferase family 39 protein [Nocardia transvalensis]MBB5918247.1 4-amino-4-deoxy-L-arabinose transferase-like glycosyltransferase [Nocardia transvalensis]
MTATTPARAVPAPVVPDPPHPAPARRWERLALIALLLGTAVAYLWNITVNGMGNGFYAASAWSGSRDWKALLFGSLDPGNFITVDKPPLSQWVMGLSGQLFGFGSASLMAPQALMAVATVALIYGALTRVTGSRGCGLLGGFVFAVTPVAALMFRFDNPDAVMVLLMTAGAYCVIRALPRANVWWLAGAGAALGFAFLAKMLEGLMVLPALALAYLVVAPTTLGRRLLHLVAAAAALLVASGWYVLLTILWPASSRPYLAGSKDNTFMDLVLGYNGFARYLGHNHQGRKPFQLPPGYEMPHFGGRGPGGFGSGPTRLFTGEIGFEISWLLPAAVVAFALVLIARFRSPRTDPVRGAALVFGLWLVIDGAAFTGMQGGMHAYYTLAIAPAVAGTFALGVHEVWHRRGTAFGRIGGAALILAGGVWTFVVLHRNSDWQPWLRWTVLVVTIVAAAGLLAMLLPAAARRVPRRFAAALLAAGLLVALGGSTAYAAATLPQSHTGGSPTVGPARPQSPGPTAGLGGNPLFRGDGDYDPRLISMLRATTTRWSAAIDRSSPAAGLELASRTPVIAIGGFTSEDPVPTVPQFQDMVRRHEVTYYLAPEVDLPDSWRTGDKSHHPEPPAAQPNPQSGQWHPVGDTDLYNWVAAHYTAQHMNGLEVYDLTAPSH